MEPQLEMLMTLFAKETIYKASNLLKSDEKVVVFDSFDMTFRLFKATSFNVNLEIFVKMSASNKEEFEFIGSTQVQLRTEVNFYKPIGFYHLGQRFSRKEIEVTMVSEFDIAYDRLLRMGKIPSYIWINQLSIEENAILAAFSMEAVKKAEKLQDSSFIANGLNCDIFMTFDGIPQFFLDDR